MPTPHYPPAFLELNYRFGVHIAQVTGIDVGEALLRYTHLYLAFGLGRSFDPSAPAWMNFLQGLAATGNPAAWINQTYLERTGGVHPSKPEHPHGVFSYALWEGGRIRLHFFGGPPGTPALRKEDIPRRMAELRALVAEVRLTIPEAKTFVGGSWLYNIEAYRRLFPPAYLATACPEEPEPQFIALWGQFLDHHRQLKTDVAGRFIAAYEAQPALDGMLRAFPYPVLRLEAPVDVFTAYYGEP